MLNGRDVHKRGQPYLERIIVVTMTIMFALSFLLSDKRKTETVVGGSEPPEEDSHAAVTTTPTHAHTGSISMTERCLKQSAD